MRKKALEFTPGGSHSEVREDLDFLAVHGPTEICSQVTAVRVSMGIQSIVKAGAVIEVIRISPNATVLVEQGAQVKRVILDDSKSSAILPAWDFRGSQNAALGLEASVNLHSVNSPGGQFLLNSYPNLR